jgi:hypothetical protein
MDDHSKKHHYVPQSILRRFSSNKARTMVHVFDKTEMRGYKSSILNAGCENYFNTVEVEGQSISFERLFQATDDQLARLLNMIVLDRSLANITPIDRLMLSEAVAAQIIRTKMVRTTMRSIAEQLSDSMRRAGLISEELDGFPMPTDQEVRRAALASLLDLQQIVDAIQKKDLILIHCSDSTFFWISDNPVVLHNTFPYGELGLNAPGIEIYFPISPGLTLGFFCPTIGLKIQQLLSLGQPYIDRQKYSEIYRGLKEGTSVSLGPETTPFLNSLQVLRSSRFLYAQNDDFEHARSILERSPEARNVQSLSSVGEIGQGPPPRPRMPSGLWVVIYGNRNHYMIAVDRWDQNSDFLDFETRDVHTLQAIVADEPIEQAVLFQDGHERRGMRQVRIEVLNRSSPFQVRITHRDEKLNQILRSHRLPGSI